MKLQFFKSLSVKTSLTLITLVIFLFSIGLLAFYASTLMRQDLRERLGAQQFSSTAMLANEINRDLLTRVQALEVVAAKITPALLANRPALQTSLLDRPALEMLFNAGIYVTAADGVVAADAPVVANRRGHDVSARAEVVDALKLGKSSIGPPQQDNGLKAPVMSIAAPIHDTQGRVIGTLVGVNDLGRPSFLDKISKSDYGQTGYSLLIAKQSRQIITASISGRVLEVFGPGVSPLIERHLQSYEGTDITIDPQGVEVLTSAKGVPAANWYVAQSLPTAEAFAPIQAIARRWRPHCSLAAWSGG